MLSQTNEAAPADTQRADGAKSFQNEPWLHPFCPRGGSQIANRQLCFRPNNYFDLFSAVMKKLSADLQLRSWPFEDNISL